jgi:hypothetical protein
MFPPTFVVQVRDRVKEEEREREREREREMEEERQVRTRRLQSGLAQCSADMEWLMAADAQAAWLAAVKVRAADAALLIRVQTQLAQYEVAPARVEQRKDVEERHSKRVSSDSGSSAAAAAPSGSSAAAAAPFTWEGAYGVGQMAFDLDPDIRSGACGVDGDGVEQMEPEWSNEFGVGEIAEWSREDNAEEKTDDDAEEKTDEDAEGTRVWLEPKPKHMSKKKEDGSTVKPMPRAPIIIPWPDDEV